MAFGDIVLLRDRTARGPYTRAQIQEGLSRGDFSGRDLAHTPGLRDWFPLVEVLHHLDREPMHSPRPREPGLLPPLPALAGNAIPMEPSVGPRDLPAVPVGKTMPPPFALSQPPYLPSGEEKPEPLSATMTPLPPSAAPDLPPLLAESDPVTSSRPPALPQGAPALPELKPAPMRRRFMAWVIDWAVLFVPVLVAFAFAYVSYWIKGPLEHRDPETARQEQALLWRNLRELIFTVAIGFAWIYAAGLESSRWQGTVGKQCMGIIVTDEAGHRLGFLRATGRHAAKYLSALPLFLGFMAALFNSQRLAWHDRLAGTRVVER
jgi:uncharacterized RDD family membrane protein YckC